MSGIPSWARVGAKVVHKPYTPLCNGARVPGAAYPVEDAIYTIRKIVFETATGNAMLMLMEVSNKPPRGLVLEPGFDIRHFRPLHTIEDDIATHFRQHLDVREPVEA